MSAMQRKETEGNIEDWIRSGDWVALQLRISLQVLACDSQNQINHFPPGVDIIGELFMDYWGYSQAIGTYWEISENQEIRLKTLRDYFFTLDDPAYEDFWTVEALSTDPHWEEIRSLAKKALTAFNWPIEVPPPDTDFIKKGKQR
jgi:hypothetical protein